MVVLRNIVAILMMRAKSVTQGQLKIESFWNIRCDAIISVHDVTKKISCDQSLVSLAFLWEKLIILE